MKTEKYGVLVIGSGGAALRAAIAAIERRPGNSVALMTKGRLGHSGVTAKSCSDRMAFHATMPYTEPGGPDNWKYHAADVFRIGGFVSDEDLAETLARRSGEALEYLLSLGVPFQKTPGGRVDQFVTDGSEYARAAYTGPDTALRIEAALARRLGELSVTVLEHRAAVGLLKRDGRVCGALTLDENNPDEPLPVEAGAVILATGGGGQIYAQNVFPPENTGEGFGMALAAGAELVNMEFVQLGAASLATKFNCSGSMFRSMPRLVDQSGREILPEYFDRVPPLRDAGLSERFSVVFRKGASWPVSLEHDTHIVDLAVYRETCRGCRVYLDYSANPAGFSFALLPEKDQARYRAEMTRDLGAPARDASPLNRLREINPKSVAWFKARGIDLERGDPVEIGICGQHFQGGVKIHGQAETCVPGLYAAGECAGGQHGANRPGGHALLDCQVFGWIAGEAASDFAALAGSVEPDAASMARALEVFGLEEAAPGGVTASEARAAVQNIMSGCASVFRTEERLERGLEDLQKLRGRGLRTDGAGRLFAVETFWMFPLAEAVLRSALLRDESRGPHLRFSDEGSLTPLPRDEGRWRRCNVVRLGPEGMTVEPRDPVILTFCGENSRRL